MKRWFLWLLLAAPLSALADVALFADRVAQADVPPGYTHRFEEGGNTLVVSPVAAPQTEMRFSFNSLRGHVKQHPTIGKDFVRDSSRKKGRRSFELPGNGGVAFVDFSQVSDIDGTQVQQTHGLMGLDDAYVTFTVAMPEADAATPAGREALDSGLRLLLGRIRSGAP